jgi:hypothetical protein
MRAGSKRVGSSGNLEYCAWAYGCADIRFVHDGAKAMRLVFGLICRLWLRAEKCAAADIAQKLEVSQNAAESSHWNASVEQLAREPILRIALAISLAKASVKENGPFSPEVETYIPAHLLARIARIFNGGFPQRIYP